MTSLALALWNLACSTSYAADGVASGALMASVRTWYEDVDGDGYGDPASTTLGGVQPEGYVRRDGDCDDSSAAVNPRARETCNGMDDDCDPATDEVGTVSTHGAIYTSIQEAVDAAHRGGTVSLCSGLWFENVVIEKPVVLEGAGPDQSIIDGGGVGTVLSVVNGVNVTVRGLTIQHGWTSGNGGGISTVNRWSTLTVEDCVVTENHADGVGGGIASAEFVQTLISDTVVSENDADTGGGAFFEGRWWLVPQIVNSEFRGNRALGWGGAIAIDQVWIGEVSPAVIMDSVIDGNSAGASRFRGAGGGIYSSVNLALTRVVVSNNTAPNGAGVALYRAGAEADHDTEIVGNTTYYGGEGGGVYVGIGGWRGGRITGNRAAYGGGIWGDFGGVALGGVGKGVLVEATITDNHATGQGGGVWTTGGSTPFRSLRISGNSSHGEGGGLFVYGGGATFEECAIQNNTAMAGGGGMWSQGGVDSVATDWGMGASDNGPDDLVFIYSAAGDSVTYDALGMDESFVCDVATGTCE